MYHSTAACVPQQCQGSMQDHGPRHHFRLRDAQPLCWNHNSYNHKLNTLGHIPYATWSHLQCGDNSASSIRALQLREVMDRMLLQHCSFCYNHTYYLLETSNPWNGNQIANDWRQSIWYKIAPTLSYGMACVSGGALRMRYSHRNPRILYKSNKPTLQFPYLALLLNIIF